MCYNFFIFHWNEWRNQPYNACSSQRTLHCILYVALHCICHPEISKVSLCPLITPSLSIFKLGHKYVNFKAYNSHRISMYIVQPIRDSILMVCSKSFLLNTKSTVISYRSVSFFQLEFSARSFYLLSNSSIQLEFGIIDEKIVYTSCT